MPVYFLTLVKKIQLKVICQCPILLYQRLRQRQRSVQVPNLNFVNQSAIVHKQGLLSAYRKVMRFIASLLP